MNQTRLMGKLLLSCYFLVYPCFRMRYKYCFALRIGYCNAAVIRHWKLHYVIGNWSFSVGDAPRCIILILNFLGKLCEIVE